MTGSSVAGNDPPQGNAGGDQPQRGNTAPPKKPPLKRKYSTSQRVVLQHHVSLGPAPPKPAAVAPLPKPTALASMGLACVTALFAVNFTHPIETVKTRMQVQGTGFSFRAMMRSEGVAALWKGIQAAWLREASYTTVKLGGYAPIRDAIGASEKGAPFYLKFAAGALSGSIGSVCGNPFDVMKTMLMANTANPIPVSTLMARMRAEQGIAGFYRGVQANVMRACVLNGTKMACYDTIKGHVTKATGWSRKDPRCQFTSAIGAGFFMTCTVAPFDMLRTTLMNQPTNKQVYSGVTDALVQIVRKDGPFALYRGFLPIWGRFAPQATLQLVTLDTLLNLLGYAPI